MVELASAKLVMILERRILIETLECDLGRSCLPNMLSSSGPASHHLYFWTVVLKS